MQKILVSVLVLTLTSVVAYKATSAYFSDTETSTGNTFTAGTLNLVPSTDGNGPVGKYTVTSGGDGVNGNVAFSNLQPGESGYIKWAMQNTGSLDGFIDLHSITKTDNENGCNEAEKNTEPGCDADTNGELSDNMNVDLFFDADGNGINDDGTPIYSGPLSGIAADYPDLNLALADSQTDTIRMNWDIPTAVGNVIQSDSTTLGMTFELGQTADQ